MSEQKAVSGNAYKRQNSGVLGGVGGTISNTRFIDVDPGNVAFQSGAYPSVAHDDLQKANNSRAFGTITAGRYIILGYTQYLGGVADTQLSKPSSSARQSIAYRTTITTYRQSLAGWNYSTGAYLTTPTVATDSFGNDDAAVPTLAVPGELTLLYGQSAPQNLDYKAKTVG